MGGFILVGLAGVHTYIHTGVISPKSCHPITNVNTRSCIVSCYIELLVRTSDRNLFTPGGVPFLKDVFHCLKHSFAKPLTASKLYL